MTVHRYNINRNMDLDQMRMAFFASAIRDVVQDMYVYVTTDCKWTSESQIDPAVFDPKRDHDHTKFSQRMIKCIEKYVTVVKNS